jgi:hypothetical protein
MPLFGLSVSAVEKMEAKGDVKGLVKALTYKNDTDVRQRAAKALGKMRAECSVEDLANSLSFDDENVKRCALEALIMIGGVNAAKAVENQLQNGSLILLNIIEDNKAEIEWLNVQKSLEGINNGREIINLINDFNSGSSDRLANAIMRLAHPTPEAIQEIQKLASIEMAARESIKLREKAFSLIENFTKLNSEQNLLISVLLEKLNEDNPYSDRAYKALCKMDIDSLISINRILLNSGLKTNNSKLLFLKSIQMRAWGNQNFRISNEEIEFLFSMSENSCSPSVEEKSIQLMGIIAESMDDNLARRTIANLFRFLSSSFPTHSTKDEIYKTLKKLGYRDPLSLVEGLQNSEKSVNNKTAQILCEMGKKAEVTVPALIKCVLDLRLDAEVRDQVMYFIKNIGDKNSLLLELISRINDKRYEFFNKGQYELFSSIGKTAIPALLESLNQKDITIQGKAICALGAFHEDAISALPMLTEILSSPQSILWPMSIQTIGAIGHKAKTSTSQLLDILKKAPELSEIVTCALADIGAPESIDLLLRMGHYSKLRALVSFSFLTTEIIELTSDALTYEIIHKNINTDDDYIRSEYVSMEKSKKAVQVLCSKNNQLTTNILHIVSQKKDEHLDSMDEFLNYEYQRNLAVEELKKRGNPPYNLEAYYKKQETAKVTSEEQTRNNEPSKIGESKSKEQPAIIEEPEHKDDENWHNDSVM